MTLYKFPSIEQFRSVVKHVRERSQFDGLDENNEPIYNHTKKAPKLMFHGTTKLHGTNHSIVIDKEDGFYTQSRERISTPEKDNAGSSIWSHSHKEHFEKVVLPFMEDMPDAKTCIIYGEWCGGNIQAKVALNKLPKMFVIFGIKFINHDESQEWLNLENFKGLADSLADETKNIYHIEQFPTWDIEIDFEAPEEVQNKLIELTTEVEKRCPVAFKLGVDGIGEGIVWKCVTDVDGMKTRDLIFKVKGEEHAGKSKTKVLAPVDVERIKNINELVTKLTPDWRLEQMYQNVFDTLNGGTGDIKRLGEFLKAIVGDIVKEELDTITASGFEVKDLTGNINKVSRDWFMKKLDI
jgi:hypothetical protein